MAKLSIEISEELKQKMAEFPEVNWDELERKTIEAKLFELQLSHSLEMRQILLDAITSKSKLSEDEAGKFAVELGRRIKKGRFIELSRVGVL